MLYLSRLITFLYIKQEIWGLAFGDTDVSLTFTPVAESRKEGHPPKSAQPAGGPQDPGQLRAGGQRPATRLPAYPPVSPAAAGLGGPPGLTAWQKRAMQENMGGSLPGA